MSDEPILSVAANPCRERCAAFGFHLPLLSPTIIPPSPHHHTTTTTTNSMMQVRLRGGRSLSLSFGVSGSTVILLEPFAAAATSIYLPPSSYVLLQTSYLPDTTTLVTVPTGQFTPVYPRRAPAQSVTVPQRHYRPPMQTCLYGQSLQPTISGVSAPSRFSLPLLACSFSF